MIPDRKDPVLLNVTAPAALYRDPAVFERERGAIFAKAWLFLGLEADLAEAGDYVAETLAGYPLVVVRDAEGVLRGFHNVCRHRAGPLVGEAKGRCAGEFVCRYHGWRYALDGRLRAATDFGPADGFDPRDYGLFAIRVETWRGLVFVNLDADAAPLTDTLEPLDRLLGERRFAAASLRRSHALACNWKVYVENYLEGYHIAMIHPALAAEVETGRYAVRMDGEVAIHEVPSVAGAAEGLWAWVWPNLALNLYRNVLIIEPMRPHGSGHTQLDYIYLFEADAEGLDAAIVTSERLTDEDRWICERVQENLNAGVYDRGALSARHENGVRWFQARVIEALDASTDTPAANLPAAAKAGR
jgi:choline monooxygenase